MLNELGDPVDRNYPPVPPPKKSHRAWSMADNLSMFGDVVAYVEYLLSIFQDFGNFSSCAGRPVSIFPVSCTLSRGGESI